MNWKDLENKYPKGYSLFQHWYNNISQLGFRRRDLYDFFDENGIIIEIAFGYESDENSHKGFMYDIMNEDIGLRMPFFYSRKEAEEAAFMKAFSILENQLLELKDNGNKH